MSGLIKIPPTFGQVARNDLDGTVGYVFSPDRNITIDALGRFVGSVNAANHLVRVWTDLGVLVASATITPASTLDADGYRFEPCIAVTLLGGSVYIIGSDENNAGDNWLDSAQASASLLDPNTLTADLDQALFQRAFSSPAGFPLTLGPGNICFAKPQLYEQAAVVPSGSRRRRSSGRGKRPWSKVS